MTRTTLTLILTFLTVTSLTSCEQTDGINIEYETKKGIRQYNSDSLSAAIETFTKVIKQTDTCSECFQYRAFAYKDLEDYEKSLQDMNSFIQLDTSAAVGYANRASVYYMTNDYPNALDDFKKALDLNPENTIMYNPISHMLFATGQKDEACKYYQKALAIGDTTFNEMIIEHCEQE